MPIGAFGSGYTMLPLASRGSPSAFRAVAIALEFGTQRTRSPATPAASAVTGKRQAIVGHVVTCCISVSDRRAVPVSDAADVAGHTGNEPGIASPVHNRDDPSSPVRRNRVTRLSRRVAPPPPLQNNLGRPAVHVDTQLWTTVLNRSKRRRTNGVRGVILSSH